MFFCLKNKNRNCCAEMFKVQLLYSFFSADSAFSGSFSSSLEASPANLHATDSDNSLRTLTIKDEDEVICSAAGLAASMSAIKLHFVLWINFLFFFVCHSEFLPKNQRHRHLRPKPKTKINLGLDSEFNYIHFGIEINKRWKFLTHKMFGSKISAL